MLAILYAHAIAALVAPVLVHRWDVGPSIHSPSSRSARCHGWR